MREIKYAYLKGQTWLYRRNYPRDVKPLVGSPALKQSLKTGDVKLARVRANEVNTRYEAIVARARAGAEEIVGGDGFSWTRCRPTTMCVRCWRRGI